MGTWSYQSFGNDTACDWSYQLVETRDLSAVEAALDAVINEMEEYLEADIASEAIAAIEVLAKLLGKGTQTDSYTERIDQWVKANPIKPSDSILQKAGIVLERIISKDSEMLELWEEVNDADSWRAEIEKLWQSIL